jgi:hypothetical protein
MVSNARVGRLPANYHQSQGTWIQVALYHSQPDERVWKICIGPGLPRLFAQCAVHIGGELDWRPTESARRATNASLLQRCTPSIQPACNAN